MEFRVLAEDQVFPVFQQIRKQELTQETEFHQLELFWKKLYKKQFSVIRNRYELQGLALFTDGFPVGLLPLFFSSPSPHRFGYLHLACDLTDHEASFFAKNIRAHLHSFNQEFMGPMNGHMNLGFSTPTESNSAFLTSSCGQQVSDFLESHLELSKKREYFAFKTELNENLILKLKNKIANLPEGLTVRKISKWNYKSDIRAYTNLLNQCLEDHPLFEPLSWAEDWELMRVFFSMLHTEYFLFLEHEGKPIAFCFGVPDFTESLKPGHDSHNIFHLLRSKNNVRKGRIIYSGILPEHRGKGWFKFIRYQVLINMFKNGIQEVDSSYVDQDNLNSQNNVKSVGGATHKTFNFWTLSPTSTHHGEASTPL